MKKHLTVLIAALFLTMGLSAQGNNKPIVVVSSKGVVTYTSPTIKKKMPVTPGAALVPAGTLNIAANASVLLCYKGQFKSLNEKGTVALTGVFEEDSEPGFDFDADFAKFVEASVGMVTEQRLINGWGARITKNGDGYGAGVTNPDKGRDGAGTGLTNPDKGRDGSGKGVTNPDKGRDGAGNGVTNPDKGRDGAGKGVTNPDKGRDGAGNGVTNPDKGRDGAGSGVTNPDKGRDGAGSGVTNPDKGRDGAGSGVTNPDKGRDGAGAGVTNPDKGRDGAGAGVTNPDKGRDGWGGRGNGIIPILPFDKTLPGKTTFFWSKPADITSYRLDITDDKGNVIHTVTASDTSAVVNLDSTKFLPGQKYFWTAAAVNKPKVVSDPLEITIAGAAEMDKTQKQAADSQIRSDADPVVVELMHAVALEQNNLYTEAFLAYAALSKKYPKNNMVRLLHATFWMRLRLPGKAKVLLN
ncbi:MAG: hypothetical protein ACKVU2_14995 [Saprospiraceae bacterium]